MPTSTLQLQWPTLASRYVICSQIAEINTMHFLRVLIVFKLKKFILGLQMCAFGTANFFIFSLF